MPGSHDGGQPRCCGDLTRKPKQSDSTEDDKGQNIYNKAAKATKMNSKNRDGKIGFEFPVRNFFAVFVVLLSKRLFVFDLGDDAL